MLIPSKYTLPNCKCPLCPNQQITKILDIDMMSTVDSFRGGKPLIPIPTDPVDLDTECIGIPSSSTSRRRRTNGRKRSAHESDREISHYDATTRISRSSSSSTKPQRKKRKPNKSHRAMFPGCSDEHIRRRLSLERKAKNRKSAQESRERRKRQEEYLNHRLPKGLALKTMLLSELCSVCKVRICYHVMSRGDVLRVEMS